jgi:hypothetical protein
MINSKHFVNSDFYHVIMLHPVTDVRVESFLTK